MSGATEQPSLLADLRVLWHLLASPVRGKTHGERLESFYRDQAKDYDSFRARMLHGRKELMSWIEFPEAGTWLDVGAGTGHNVFAIGDRARSLKEIHLVDLAPSLLKVASQRAAESELDNVQVHETDATTFSLPESSVDVVTFSYSLTMIPDWFQAIAVAERILKPGGVIAVVDFYVSRKYASSEQAQHAWLRRWFWSLWFASDNVYLSSDHFNMLHRRFIAQRCEERLGKVPYMPMIRAPYYLFLGRKPNNLLVAKDTSHHVQ